MANNLNNLDLWISSQDENIEDLGSLVTAWKDNAADVVNIKIGKFGGLTKAKRVNKTNSYSLKCLYKRHLNQSFTL